MCADFLLLNFNIYLNYSSSVVYCHIFLIVKRALKVTTKNFKWDLRELPMFFLHIVSKKLPLSTCEFIEVNLNVSKVFWEMFFFQERQAGNLIWEYCRMLFIIRNNPNCENSVSKYIENVVKCMYIIKDHFLSQNKQNKKINK